MKDNISISVKDLCIEYRPLKSFSIQKALFRHKEKERIVHAVNDVSFEVKKGEILGIIGKNGSGKSTLLRAIGGIFQPDMGNINLNGQSVSLLAIGVGFRTEMTGRANIMLSGMLLGFSEKEILAKEEKIIEFAELGDFIDMPVRTYSSGMYSKLAFSITAMLETDILLIDEVLSVGDEHFRKKSSDKMKELIEDNQRTVLIVSHSVTTLRELCHSVLWLDAGKVKEIGRTDEVLDHYNEYMNAGKR